MVLSLLPVGGPEKSPLPPIRRIVTHHNEKAEAIVAIDDTLKASIMPSGSAAQTIWSSDTIPADVTVQGDRATIPVPIVNSGSIIRIVDFPPHSPGHMHRTTSLDYIILMSGKLVMHLDDGSSTTLSAGDVVVQNGTNHRWENTTGEWVRIIGVLFPAKEVVIGGQRLGHDTASMNQEKK